jgi:DeoR family glycerol-3-phosphate regulon repressor
MFNQRQEHILQEIQKNGQVKVDDLSESLEVTTQTIRRDLSLLCDNGLAARIHGGARRIISTSMVAYEDRRQADVDSKLAIAQSTALLIPNDSSIAINIGTTTEHVAYALKLHKGLTIISNNINIVHILQNTALKSLNIIGGEVRMSDGAIVGSGAVDAIRNYKVDYAVIGASSLDVDGSILDFDQREVAVSQAIIASARTRILVSDNSKFDVSAPYKICDIKEIDYVVTDTEPPTSFSEIAHHYDTKIIIADKNYDKDE